MTGCSAPAPSTTSRSTPTYSTSYQSKEPAAAWVQSSTPKSALDQRPAVTAVPVPRWTCYYDATYNRDWHDDVLCTNGTKRVRPYLREWDNFVTEAEIMKSAAEYEAKLNAGR